MTELLPNNGVYSYARLYILRVRTRTPLALPLCRLAPLYLEAVYIYIIRYWLAPSDPVQSSHHAGRRGTQRGPGPRAPVLPHACGWSVWTPDEADDVITQDNESRDYGWYSNVWLRLITISTEVIEGLT